MGIQEKETTEEKCLRNSEFEKGRYEVQLTWRKNHQLLNDKYVIVKICLNSELLSAYRNVMKDRLESGVTEKYYQTK